MYCIDPNKQDRWHLHLCALLQELLDLPEPPHFLVPCFTATVDRWRDPKTQAILTSAEAAPMVLRFQALLNVVFDTNDLVWQTAQMPEVCDPIVLATHRRQFPQLWETHDLLVRYEQAVQPAEATRPNASQFEATPPEAIAQMPPEARGYVLRLFVSGHSAATERTLHSLHQLLEQSLGQPYTLKVIDVSQHPEQAELDQVSATPTLVKAWPRPVRRIVGSLDNIDRLLRILGPLESRGDEI